MENFALERRGFFKKTFLMAGKAAMEFQKGMSPEQERKVTGRKKDYSLRPPGAVTETTFLELCTRCDDCINACPHKSIKKSTRKEIEGTPIILPREEPCALCQDLPCIKACATGALVPVERENVAMGVARINKKKCFAWDGQDCQFCSVKCPVPDALYLDDFRPVIREEKCAGCGLCEQACATKNNSAPIRVIPSIWTQTDN